MTHSFEQRAQIANDCWVRGQQAEAAGQCQEAYALFTQAHDSILDCAALHRNAHVHLYRINKKTHHYRERMEDWALLNVLGPLGFFAAFAWVTKRGPRYAKTRATPSHQRRL